MTSDPGNRDPAFVLIVDDQPENLISMEALLSSPDVRLVLTRSGKEALRAILEYDFALILLDVQMPVMDGFETAEIIRQRERSRHTPIIFVTAINKSDRNIFHGYTFGAVDYVFKPFMPEILKSKVEVFVDLYRKTAEIQKQKEHLERINQELELYSHTLVEALPAALHRVESLLDGVQNRLASVRDPELAALAPALESDSLRLKRLFAPLLDFSQADGDFQVRPFPLERVCQEAIKRCQSHAEAASVRWVVSALPEVPGDERLLLIVFENLLSNALRFTRNTGLPVIEIGSYPEDEAVVVYVKDNGAGFEMTGETNFSGVSQRLGSGDFEGVGVSIAVAQRIVRRHGGRFWAHPEPGKGSIFYFSLPSRGKAGPSHEI